MIIKSDIEKVGNVLESLPPKLKRNPGRPSKKGIKSSTAPVTFRLPEKENEILTNIPDYRDLVRKWVLSGMIEDGYLTDLPKDF